MTTELEGLLVGIRTEAADPLHRYALADFLDENPHLAYRVPLTAGDLRQFNATEPMSRASFRELCGADLANEHFLRFAGVLELEGRYTQAELIRAALRLRDDLTPPERTLLGVPDALSQAAFDRLTERHARLQSQFAEETFGTVSAVLLLADSSRISFDRGVIRNLDLSALQMDLVPANLQILNNFTASGQKIASLPSGLQIGGDASLIGRRIGLLPSDLCVHGDFHLLGPDVPPAVAQQIPHMVGLSVQAKFSALTTAGYNALADQVVRDASRNGADLPPY